MIHDLRANIDFAPTKYGVLGHVYSLALLKFDIIPMYFLILN